MKKISIITITYNSEKTVEDTIRSILNQNYKMLEYIIIDGGSTDNTLKIIDKYKDKISYFISEPDNGISDAFNKGIKASTGDVIGIINSDDMLYTDALKHINDKFEADNELDVVHGNVLRFNDGESVGRLSKPSGKLSDFAYQFPMFHPTVFVTAAAYQKHGLFDVNCKNAMDFELLSRMYFNGANFAYIDEIISCFRLGGVSQMAHKRTIEEHCRIAERNGASKKELKKHIRKLKAVHFCSTMIKKLKIEGVVRKVLQNPQYIDLPVK